MGIAVTLIEIPRGILGLVPHAWEHHGCLGRSVALRGSSGDR